MPYKVSVLQQVNVRERRNVSEDQDSQRFVVHSVHPTPCKPVDCITPGFPILHHLPELAKAHVH